MARAGNKKSRYYFPFQSVRFDACQLWQAISDRKVITNYELPSIEDFLIFKNGSVAEWLSFIVATVGDKIDLKSVESIHIYSPRFTYTIL